MTRMSQQSSLSRSRLLLGVLAIALTALNLRTAVVSVSPIYAFIRASFPINAAAQGAMGTLPLFCFAAFGMLGSRIASRLGLERGLMLALAMIAAGEVLRAALANSIVQFGAISVLSLGGMGLGNVLLPPVIKQLFPKHVGALTSLYLVLVAVSASAPALVAVPLTHAMGWRLAVGVWSLFAIAAALPWAGLLRGTRSPGSGGAAPVAYNAWRWPTSWAITIVFAVGALDMYALIAWLPTILTETAGVTAATAGLMLAIYNFIGFPHSLVVPIILAKTRRPYLVVAFAALCLGSGTLGLGYLPQWSWVWIFPAGLGAMFVPIGLTLINMRARTEEGTTALSGMVQSAGYLIAAAGPVIVGFLHSETDHWLMSCWFLAGTGVAGAVAGWIAVRPVFIEDANQGIAGQRAISRA
jgi:MFS transporter, CP family, cyanate transporter